MTLLPQLPLSMNTNKITTPTTTETTVTSAGAEMTIEAETDSPLIIFNPGEDVMYPLRGDLQDLSRKRGVEVDVKGWGDVMEGASRRTFPQYNISTPSALTSPLMISCPA